MNSKFKKSVIALVFVCTSIQAQIPVTDTAQIMTHVVNQVESVAKWTLQLQEMKRQIDQAKQHYESVRGARGLGNILNATGIKINLPENLNALLESYRSNPSFKNARAKYPINPDRPKQNAIYDTIVLQNIQMEDLITKANKRMNQVSSLMDQIDAADDPAAKQDLANRLINEQNSIQATAELAKLIQSKNKADLEAAHNEAFKEFRCKEFKKTGC